MFRVGGGGQTMLPNTVSILHPCCISRILVGFLRDLRRRLEEVFLVKCSGQCLAWSGNSFITG